MPIWQIVLIALAVIAVVVLVIGFIFKHIKFLISLFLLCVLVGVLLIILEHFGIIDVLDDAAIVFSLLLK